MKGEWIPIFIMMFGLIVDSGGGQNAAAEGKRSAIVEADGYAFLAEDNTIRQIREEALANAKRQALERAQTHIRSVTKVENFMLTYDLVQSAAEGTVRVLESQDHGVTGDNRYHYWIKAEVQYVINPPEEIEQDIKTADDPTAPLTVSVWTEKTEYRTGDEIHILLKGNKEFYATIVYRNAAGRGIQILPNQHRQSRFFTAGRIWRIPSEQDHFRLVVQEPYGPEEIIVYASTAEPGSGDVVPEGETFYRLTGTLENYSAKTRGVRITEKEQPAEFYEASCELVTKENHE